VRDVGLLSIVTGAFRDDNIEAWSFLSMPFVWILGAVFVIGYVLCFILGKEIGKNWNSDTPPLIKKVLDNLTKNPVPKLKDPSHYMRGPK
jgi:hypothetical protein